MEEPSLIRKKSFTEKIMGKRNIIVTVAVILVITLFIGTSYSLLTNFDIPNNAIIIEDDDLRMTMNNTDGKIMLKNRNPESDEMGQKNSAPIVLTFSNTGNVNIMKFEVILNKESNTTLDEKDIRYSYSTDLGVHYSEPQNLDNNIIYTGYNLLNNKAKTMYLKIWIDEDASDAINKEYYGKVRVKLYKTSEVPYAINEVKKQLGELGGIKQVSDTELRYIDSNSNNYVNFNYELWRIIGIFRDTDNYEYLRIVKDDVLDGKIIPDKFVIASDEKITYNLGHQGDGRVYFEGNLGNTWNEVGLKYYLNQTTDDEGNRGYLSYLSNASKSMIKDNTSKVELLTKNDIQGDWYKNLSKPSWMMESNGNGVLNLSNGEINTINPSSLSYVRPVINLNSMVVILSGDGTKNAPYELSL